jgi:hypothetical protein
VTYKGQHVGEYFADILIEDILVVELKCADRLASEHTAQCLNYLRASSRTLCLLVNFQKPRVEWKRIVNGFEFSESAQTLGAVARDQSGAHRVAMDAAEKPSRQHDIKRGQTTAQP